LQTTRNNNSWIQLTVKWWPLIILVEEMVDALRKERLRLDLGETFQD